MSGMEPKPCGHSRPWSDGKQRVCEREAGHTGIHLSDIGKTWEQYQWCNEQQGNR